MPTTEKNKIVDLIGRSGIVAIVRLSDLSAAVDLSRAILAGGVTAIEFTMNNPAAVEAIAAVKAALPDFAAGRAVIGAGTVLTPEMVRATVEAGGQFVVSPNTSYEVIATCLEAGVPAIPGALTPTEIVNAVNAGAGAVKIFPARAFGPGYTQDVLAPLPDLKLVPTGGIDVNNAADYIAKGAFALGVGSSLVDKQLVAARNWAALTERATAFVRAVQQGRVD